MPKAAMALDEGDDERLAAVAADAGREVPIEHVTINAAALFAAFVGLGQTGDFILTCSSSRCLHVRLK